MDKIKPNGIAITGPLSDYTTGDRLSVAADRIEMTGTFMQLTNDFRGDLERLLNHHSKERGSDTPDFILANYLTRCLDAFDEATTARTRWYGPNVKEAPAQGQVANPARNE